jgi:hypothetical protein
VHQTINDTSSGELLNSLHVGSACLTNLSAPRTGDNADEGMRPYRPNKIRTYPHKTSPANLTNSGLLSAYTRTAGAALGVNRKLRQIKQSIIDKALS